MFVRPLLTAALLVLGVVGCDDPEVQAKVESVMEHGVSSAELQCAIFQTTSWDGSGVNMWLTYTATKFIDGSCFTNLCLHSGSYQGWGPGFNSQSCNTRFWARSQSQGETCTGYIQFDPDNDLGLSTRPYRPLVDGLYANVEDGTLQFSLRDYRYTDGVNHCNGTCSDPDEWFTYDITNSGCTGRNLSAFGVD